MYLSLSAKAGVVRLSSSGKGLRIMKIAARLF
jgi:hypothetical protein